MQLIHLKLQVRRGLNQIQFRSRNSPTFILSILCIYIRLTLQDLCTGKVKGIGKEEAGLYILPSTTKHLPLANALHHTSSPAVSFNSTCSNHHPSDLTTWHLRLGHAPVAVLTIVDDYSRMTWVFLLRYKSEVVNFISAFINLVKTQFSATIKTIRSDNGLEFFNNQCHTIFSSLGIVHQSTCVHTPQQNGIAERKHKHLLEIARALRFQAHVPLKFWGDCILTATFLINILPSTVLAGKSPYEIFHKHPPKLHHLRVFGCLCYATTPLITDKFSPKALPSVFMGYSDTQKGYKLYNIATGIFFVSRDVIFKEHIFPFQHPKHTFLSSLPLFHTSTFPNSQSAFPYPSDDVFPPTSPSPIPLNPDISSSAPASPVLPSDPPSIPSLRKSSRVTKPPI
ncbi:hypothetical protein AABB24_003396 [Solanum stoloniferum]|uniref:Integrase catalytic domain-containing protein n=1 Tax=Solanum stoloniferum TaxID=62892 RepID=A0ABD2V991_9SOLN